MKPLWVMVSVFAAVAIGFAGGRWSATLPAPQSQPSTTPPHAMPPSPLGGGSFLPKRAPQETVMVQGTILEVIQVPTYTYVRLANSNGGESWAAVESNQNLKPGSAIVIEGATLMEDFASKSLNRNFPQIYFGREKKEG